MLTWEERLEQGRLWYVERHYNDGDICRTMELTRKEATTLFNAPMYPQEGLLRIVLVKEGPTDGSDEIIDVYECEEK